MHKKTTSVPWPTNKPYQMLPMGRDFSIRGLVPEPILGLCWSYGFKRASECFSYGQQGVGVQEFSLSGFSAYTKIINMYWHSRRSRRSTE